MTAPSSFAPGQTVDVADHVAIIDLLNRFNLAVDIWDIDTMVGLFAEDGAVLHPRGSFQGHEELRRFYDAYRPLVPGTRRQALNHVVDGNLDGTVSITFYMLIVRVAEPADADAARANSITESTTGLPANFIHSIVTAKAGRVAPDTWRILEYQVDGTIADHAQRREN